MDKSTNVRSQCCVFLQNNFTLKTDNCFSKPAYTALSEATVISIISSVHSLVIAS